MYRFLMATAVADTRTVCVTLTRRHGYEFQAVVEDGRPEGFLVDEDPPLGSSAGPSASALVATAVADCLASSLMFCLAKTRVELQRVSASAVATLQRNPQGRLRISNIGVEIRPALSEAARPRLERCESLFEDFCIATQSIRQGIPIDVSITPEFDKPETVD
jgi:organic hydroperoxide reductase OsmC/OhrA